MNFRKLWSGKKELCAQYEKFNSLCEEFINCGDADLEGADKAEANLIGADVESNMKINSWFDKNRRYLAKYF